MRYYVTLAGRTVEVDLSGDTPIIDGVPVAAELATLPGTPLRTLLVGGRSYAFTATQRDRRGRWAIDFGSDRFVAEAIDERTRALREMAGGAEAEAEKTIAAPMPGLVLKVEVEVGDAVRAGQGVVIVEAMKMENELKAPADGVVAQILAVPGQTVEKGATLLVLE
jgi:pyruvate carboxylase subunit B